MDILHLAAVMLENIILGENIPINIFFYKRICNREKVTKEYHIISRYKCLINEREAKIGSRMLISAREGKNISFSFFPMWERIKIIIS